MTRKFETRTGALLAVDNLLFNLFDDKVEGSSVTFSFSFTCAKDEGLKQLNMPEEKSIKCVSKLDGLICEIYNSNKD